MVPLIKSALRLFRSFDTWMNVHWMMSADEEKPMNFADVPDSFPVSDVLIALRVARRSRGGSACARSEIVTARISSSSSATHVPLTTAANPIHSLLIIPSSFAISISAAIWTLYLFCLGTCPSAAFARSIDALPWPFQQKARLHVNFFLSFVVSCFLVELCRDDQLVSRWSKQITDKSSQLITRAFV